METEVGSRSYDSTIEPPLPARRYYPTMNAGALRSYLRNRYLAATGSLLDLEERRKDMNYQSSDKFIISCDLGRCPRGGTRVFARVI